MPIDPRMVKWDDAPDPAKVKWDVGPAEPVSDFSGNLRIGSLDTGIALPDSVNKRLAQLGSGFADLGLGVQQLLGKATPQDALDKRQADANLNTDLAGKVLNITGKALPSLAVPMVGGPIAGSALIGAGMGATEPVAPGESRLKNTLISAGLGALIPAGLAGGRAMFTPADTVLAQKALDYGIPLGAADMSANRLVKATRSVLNDTPFIGSIGGAQNVAKQAAFNKAVGGTFGADAGSLTPDVLTAAKGKITSELNRVWDNNSLKLDPGLINDYTRIGQRAADLNPEQQALVVKQMQKLLVKADNSEIAGSAANNWQSELRLAVDGEKGLAKDVLNDLRQSTLRAFNRGVSPEDAAALTRARTQYANFKTVEPLLTKGELGVAGRTAGDVPAALLSGQVNQQMGARAVGSPLGELSAIGSRYIADRVAQTGGSPRAMVQNSILGSALAGSGGLASLPMAGATAGAAGFANWALGSPTIGRALLNPGVQRGLLDAPQFTPAMLEAIKRGAALAPVGAGLSLLE